MGRVWVVLRQFWPLSRVPPLTAAVHSQHTIAEPTMPRAKNETLTLRTTAEIKSLLRQAADREHRSLASMVEVLVLDYANGHKLKPDRGAAGRRTSRS